MSEIEISWRIEKLEWDVILGGVVSALWSVVARENETEGSITLQSNFSPDFSSPDFIPIRDLTESKVIEWVKKGITPRQISIYETAAKEALLRQQMPPLVSGLPWRMPT